MAESDKRLFYESEPVSTGGRWVWFS